MPRSWNKNGFVWKGRRTEKGRFLPELWSSIQNINAHLEEYSRTRENVEYFDANDVFLQGEDKKLKIEKELNMLRQMFNTLNMLKKTFKMLKC